MVVTDDAAAVTGADGRFSLDNVPPGTYELRIWHEVAEERAAEDHGDGRQADRDHHSDEVVQAGLKTA